MNKDLTTSDLHRKNILNNNHAVGVIYKEIAFPGIFFEGEFRFTKKQVAEFFEVDERTIDRYIDTNKFELEESGYQVLTRNQLKRFKEIYGNDINVVTIDESLNRTSILGTFTFRAFLNIGMLLTESEKAKLLRAFILNIVIDTINNRLGGSTKYINQRDEEFLTSSIKEHSYRREFTDALKECIEPNKFKYAQLTDKVYKSIFKEDAKEYRQILTLKEKDNIRSTMYAEVLDLISSYENGFADFLKKHSAKINRKLKLTEANALFTDFEEQTSAIYEPLCEKARMLMASRDMAFREALHEKLKNYITYLSSDEFDKFLGEKSMDLEARILDNIDVFKRLKDR